VFIDPATGRIQKIGPIRTLGKPGKFRTIKVKVNRKGAIVRHRKGYIGS